ncbi:HPr kinase/phosphorylase [Paenibacillus plantiphilus]|nr:aldolase [Paenibacillus plantiphilus]
MILTRKKMIYRAFGLRVLSEFPLPELVQVDDCEGQADVVIERADLSGLWNGLEVHHQFFAVKDKGIIHHIPDTAILCIQEGKRILVSPMAGAEENKIRLYLLGTCMGTILMQRGILPLHGSAVAINGKAYAFVGNSGAGKSTLAAALLSKGYSLLSDDVIAVSQGADGIPIVTPSYPQQKLWQASIEQLGLGSHEYKPIYEEINKYAIPVRAEFCSDPIPLGGVFELVRTEEGEVHVEEVQSLQRFPLIHAHTYRNFLIPLLECEQWHFSSSASTLSRIDVYQLRRPLQGFTAYELVELIERIVNKGA